MGFFLYKKRLELMKNPHNHLNPYSINILIAWVEQQNIYTRNHPKDPLFLSILTIQETTKSQRITLTICKANETFFFIKYFF